MRILQLQEKAEQKIQLNIYAQTNSFTKYRDRWAYFLPSEADIGVAALASSAADADGIIHITASDSELSVWLRLVVSVSLS